MEPETRVKTSTSYGVYDYEQPVNKLSNDFRTAYYRGHRLIDVPDTGAAALTPNSCHYSNFLALKPDYTSENAAQFTWKCPKRYHMNADRSMRCNRGQLVGAAVHMLTQKPPRPIVQYDTVYHRDYTAKKPIVEHKITIDNVSKHPKRPTTTINPNSPGYSKYLDIYMTTKCMDHVPFSVEQQNGIARKDNVTLWDWLEYPKSVKGYGLKEFPAKHKTKKLPIWDQLQFKSPIYNRILPNTPKIVPNFGMSTEMRSSYAYPKELDFKCDGEQLNPITIPPTGLHEIGKTEYAIYGSGEPTHKYIDSSLWVE